MQIFLLNFSRQTNSESKIVSCDNYDNNDYNDMNFICFIYLIYN